MRIVQITPGSGDNFYCENCLRDLALVRALRHGGHDALMVPLYLPPGLNEPQPPTTAPIFFGGVNVYLQQKLSIFRHTPRWLDKLLDSPRILRWAAHKAGMTRAKDLGETTLSMLRGEDGRQVKELDRLADWLAQPPQRPDVVVLSNAMLAGMARRLKERLAVPIVCMLQDEDGFLDSMPQPYRTQVWEALSACTRHIDVFVPVSQYYADVIARRLPVARADMPVVYPGVGAEGREPAPPHEPPVVGFLSRMCEGKGLHLLVDAFTELRAKPGLEGIRLRISGGMIGLDEAYVAGVKARIAQAGAEAAIEFVPDFDRASRLEFMKSLSVMCVPQQQPEACGLFVLEAMAHGVPVVEPAIGVIPELVGGGAGGLLYDPAAPGAMMQALEKLLRSPALARELGAKGREVFGAKFTAERMADGLVSVCEMAVKRGGANG